jgi:hypothetical protein
VKALRVGAIAFLAWGGLALSPPAAFGDLRDALKRTFRFLHLTNRRGDDRKPIAKTSELTTTRASNRPRVNIFVVGRDGVHVVSGDPADIRRLVRAARDIPVTSGSGAESHGPTTKQLARHWAAWAGFPKPKLVKRVMRHLEQNHPTVATELKALAELRHEAYEKLENGRKGAMVSMFRDADLVEGAVRIQRHRENGYRCPTQASYRILEGLSRIARYLK